MCRRTGRAEGWRRSSATAAALERTCTTRSSVFEMPCQRLPLGYGLVSIACQHGWPVHSPGPGRAGTRCWGRCVTRDHLHSGGVDSAVAHLAWKGLERRRSRSNYAHRRAGLGFRLRPPSGPQSVPVPTCAGGCSPPKADCVLTVRMGLVPGHRGRGASVEAPGALVTGASAHVPRPRPAVAECASRPRQPARVAADRGGSRRSVLQWAAAPRCPTGPSNTLSLPVGLIAS